MEKQKKYNISLTHFYLMLFKTVMRKPLNKVRILEPTITKSLKQSQGCAIILGMYTLLSES